MKMNESYEDGKALLLLADSYAGNGDTEKATEKYNRVLNYSRTATLHKRRQKH